ncbi:MAG: flagellar brake protein [Sporolactobacillus sp.]
MVFHVGATLLLKTRETSGIQHTYRCKLAEVRENELLIDYPIDEQSGKTAVLMNQTALEVNYVYGNHVYRFYTVVISRVPGTIPLMLLSYGGTDSLQKVQRRNFVRVETNQDVAIHSVDGAFKPFTTLTDDIGGGGILIALDEPDLLRENDQVEIWLSLVSSAVKNRYLKARGTVTRIFTDRVTNRLKASLNFLFASERDRQPIIRFCFEKQLESRKKMLSLGQTRSHRK